jgi:hypothetical protein
MKYVKVLGLLAVAAAALMAFAGSASATSITSPTDTYYTGNIHAVNENTHVILHSDLAGTIECKSTVEGKIETHGKGVTAAGKISTLHFSECTNSWHVTVVAPGELQIHWKANHEGTLTSTGATVSTTRFGVTCNYVTNETDIGTLTDSHTAGDTPPANETKDGTATLHIEAKIPIHSGSSGLCGSSPAEWTGSYEVTTPDKLYIDQD